MIEHNLEVLPAELAQAPLLENLLELYIHDFSEFRDLEIGQDGRFHYPSLSLYWSDADRHPFLIKLDGKPAGVALVSGTGEGWDMAEFFILRGCRRRGMGTQVAHEIWRRFPGPWQVRVMETNLPAQRFWAGAISQFAGEPAIPVHTDGWTMFSFFSCPSRGV